MKKFLKFLLIVAVNVSILLGFSNVLLPSSFSKSTGSLTLKAQGGCGFVDLAWDKVEGAVGFYIYRGTSEGNESSMPLTDFPIAENNFKDTKDLKKGTKYCYYVAALNKDNIEIARSNEACATPTCSSGEEETCEKSLKFQIGNKYYWVNDEQKGPMESVPQIKWDRTFLLIRYVSEEVNANISWDGVNRIVAIVTPDGTKLEFKIGNNKYKVNGVEKPIDPNNSKVVPFIDGGRTFIPLRVTGDNLGAKDIIWHGDTKIAELIFKVPCPQKPKGGIVAIVQCPNLVALTPISGVTINIYSYPGHSLVWSGVTDTNGKIDTGFTLPPGQYEVVPSGGSDFMCTKVLHIATVVSGQKTDIKIDCCKIETKTICACLVRMTIQPDANGNYQVYIKENCKDGDPVYDLVLNFPANILDSNLGINVLTYYNQLGGAPIPAGSGCLEVKFNPSNNSVIQWWAYPNRKPCCSCCIEPPSGMVAWWPLDETQIPVANDLAVVNNVGTWVNNPVPVTGMVNGALSFNGKNSVDVADHSELNFGKGNFSVDLWIKTSDTTDSVHTILDKRTGTVANPRGYEIYLYRRKLGLQIADGNPSNYNSSDIQSVPIIADGNWHHIAVTVGRADTSGIRFYVDGNLVAIFDPTAHQGDLTNTAPFVIGKNLLSPEQIFVGTLDEIELFNRVLSPDEIKGIYNAKSDGKCKPKIVVKDTLVDVYLLSGDKEFKIGTYKTDSYGVFQFDYPLSITLPQNPIFKFVVNTDLNPLSDKTFYIQLALAPPGKGLGVILFYYCRGPCRDAGKIGDKYMGQVAHF